MIAFFHATLYQPLYNALIYLIDVLPGADVGLAVLTLTVFVKLVLLPLSEKATATQLAVKMYEKDLEEVKRKYKDDKDGQAKAILKFYKDHDINPFSGFLVLFIQLPIVISLYYVFYKGGLPAINKDLLYSFVKVPEVVDMHFLGVLDVAAKSVLLAFLVGITQFYQMKLSFPPLPKRDSNQKEISMKEELSRSMNLQMRFVMPVVTALIAYGISGAVALYWTTSNIFAIAQELYLRRKFKHLRVEVTDKK
jgi:YidC/Oxa1 family membrane protein insertase